MANVKIENEQNGVEEFARMKRNLMIDSYLYPERVSGISQYCYEVAKGVGIRITKK